MVKDFIPCDINRLNEFIEEYRKIKEIDEEEEKELFFKLLHNNFCRYINIKGKNKGVICLNRFKDINELKYCNTHRWEMKPWKKCQFNLCNGNTKKDYCRNCKKILNKPLPPITNEEIIDLSNEYIHYEIIKTIIPNAKYRIINYHLHNYYKIHTISMNLIMPSYNENGIKIKKIKNNEYCKYFYKSKNKFLENLNQDIKNYNIYNDFNMKIFYIIVKIVIKIKKIRKRYISIEKASNVPLPPVSIDEKILLNIDINNLYEKKLINKKDSNNKILELDISENNFKNEEDEKYKLFCKLFEKKCNVCHSYKRFIMDMCKINVNLYNILINAFNDIKNHNISKIDEIFNILKKPKIKPININKIYNDLPQILNYNDKLDNLIKIEIKELCKISYVIYDDIDKSVFNDILGHNFSKYLFN